MCWFVITKTKTPARDGFVSSDACVVPDDDESSVRVSQGYSYTYHTENKKVWVEGVQRSVGVSVTYNGFLYP
jgi:hypothetical protein